MKKALVLGINGQDGSYLADILISAGYEVHGLVRRNSQPNLWRIQGCLDRLTIHQGDLLDAMSLRNVIHTVLPDEIYNEADQDHVGFSASTPSYSASITYGAVANILELIKGFKGKSQIKLFQPLSATMFGDAPAPQTLKTPFNPQSPYACAKAAAYYLCKHYREKYGVFVSTAILYNHDSVRRQGDYLLHKICKGCVRIKHGDQKTLDLTNLQAKVDIGYAKDYMATVFERMQLTQPTDSIIGSGNPTTIFTLVKEALEATRLLYSPYLWLENPNDQYDTRYENSKWLSPIRENYCQTTKSVIDLIHDLCDHYKRELYGEKL